MWALISLLPVVFYVKLSESESRLQEADNKYEVLSHTLRDKQTVCDMLQSHVDVSFMQRYPLIPVDGVC